MAGGRHARLAGQGVSPGRRAPGLSLLLGFFVAGCAAGSHGGDEEDLSLLARILIGLGFVLTIFGVAWVNRENR